MLLEFLSLLSCLLNVLAAFGTTLKDRKRGMRRVTFVNWLNRAVTGETNHRRKAWDGHLAFWRERMALRAPPA